MNKARNSIDTFTIQFLVFFDIIYSTLKFILFDYEIHLNNHENDLQQNEIQSKQRYLKIHPDTNYYNRITIVLDFDAVYRSH